MKHFSELSASAEKVLDAAEGLVQRFGYNGFSYDDIAQQVGIKKPSIHHHFATKAQLVATVAQRFAQRFFVALDAIEQTHTDAHLCARPPFLCVRHSGYRGRRLATAGG